MILLTGAAGVVGRMLRPHLAAAGRDVRLTDIVRVQPRYPTETFTRARLQWHWQMRRLCRGVDVVVHLGAKSRDASWRALADVNVLGVTNLLDAAREAGVKRFIFTSTMHVFGLYPRSTPLHEDMPPSPDGRYGASKVCGEAAVTLYATKYGLPATTIRIGHAVDGPTLPVNGVAADDLAALVLREIDSRAPGLRLLHAVAPHESLTHSDGRLAREGFQFRHPGPSASELQAILQTPRAYTAFGRTVHGGDFADPEKIHTHRLRKLVRRIVFPD